MALTCNIDARGKFARLLIGLMFLGLAGAAALFWAKENQDPFFIALAVVCGLLGAFCVFQARAGWCVLRAMKFKTPF